jgi:hypothetical protein
MGLINAKKIPTFINEIKACNNCAFLVELPKLCRMIGQHSEKKGEIGENGLSIANPGRFSLPGTDFRRVRLITQP